MNLLDRAADGVREVLGFGSAPFVARAWFPVFAMLIFVAAMLLVRKLLPLAGQAGAARTHWFLVLLLCAGVIWTWNHGQCPAPGTASARAACVRPFTGWLDSFGTPAPPAPARKDNRKR